MKNIVKIEDYEAMVSIEDIANFSGVQKRAIIRTIRDNSKEFNRFGHLRIGKEVTNIGHMLNEAETTFLLTLLKNTKEVVKFKSDLVFQFYKMRGHICETNQKQLEVKEKQIKKLSSSIYAKPREGNYQVVDRIRQDYEIQCSSSYLNSLLIQNSIIAVEEVLIHKHISCSEFALNGVTPLIHTEKLLKIVDEQNIARGIGYCDTHPSLFED